MTGNPPLPYLVFCQSTEVQYRKGFSIPLSAEAEHEDHFIKPHDLEDIKEESNAHDESELRGET